MTEPLTSELDVQNLYMDTSIEQAREAIESKQNARHIVALPSDFKVHDLEQFQGERRRARGAMTTLYPDAFAQYAAAHAEKGASVFIEPLAMRVTAVLNLGAPDCPGHADNTALYVPEKTAAYQAIRFLVSGDNTQKTAVQFVADWSDCIECVDEAGDMLENKTAIAALRALTLNHKVAKESVQESLSATRTAFEQATVTARDTLPHLLRFTCQPYAVFQPRTFTVRVHIVFDEDKPSVKFVPVTWEVQQEQMAEELRGIVTDAMRRAGGQELPIFVGTYSSGR